MKFPNSFKYTTEDECQNLQIFFHLSSITIISVETTNRSIQYFVIKKQLNDKYPLSAKKMNVFTSPHDRLFSEFQR